MNCSQMAFLVNDNPASFKNLRLTLLLSLNQGRKGGRMKERRKEGREGGMREEGRKGGRRKERREGGRKGGR